MILSEKKLIELIRLMIVKEDFQVANFSRPRIGGKEGATGTEECEITTSTNLPLNSEKTRIKTIPEVETRFKRLRTELQAHLRASGFPNAVIGNNGLSRSLKKAADAGGNTARISGSLHGLSLANDLLIDVDFLGGTFESMGFAAANKILAANTDFVKAIHEFNQLQSDIRWGGTFGNGDTSAGEVKGRGIVEFHHFELNSTGIKDALTKSGYDKHIKALGFTVDDMLSNTKRAELFKILVGDECVDGGSVEALASDESSTESEAPSGYVAYTKETCDAARGSFDATNNTCTIQKNTGEDADADGNEDYEDAVVKFHKEDEPLEYLA